MRDFSQSTIQSVSQSVVLLLVHKTLLLMAFSHRKSTHTRVENVVAPQVALMHAHWGGEFRRDVARKRPILLRRVPPTNCAQPKSPKAPKAHCRYCSPAARLDVGGGGGGAAAAAAAWAYFCPC